MTVLVIGGGITGQLVQVACPSARVVDWRKPNSSAILTRHYGANYLWEPLPGIDCISFNVVTHIDSHTPTEEAILRYKAKIGKLKDGGDWGKQFPRDTIVGYDIKELPTRPRITFGAAVMSIDTENHVAHIRHHTGGLETVQYDTLVSTIPLYALVDVLRPRVPAIKPRYDPIFVKVSVRPPDAPYPDDVLYINYLSGPVPPYRVTDRERERHYEGLSPMGTIPTRKIVPGKIHPFPEAEDLLDSLRTHDILCFGRYGTWRPDELVHETWQDIRSTLTSRSLLSPTLAAV